MKIKFDVKVPSFDGRTERERNRKIESYLREQNRQIAEALKTIEEVINNGIEQGSE